MLPLRRQRILKKVQELDEAACCLWHGREIRRYTRKIDAGRNEAGCRGEAMPFCSKKYAASLRQAAQKQTRNAQKKHAQK